LVKTELNLPNLFNPCRGGNLDKKTTQKVAELAKLWLSDEELDRVTEKLTLVLSHFEKISNVETTGVEPLVTPIEVTQVLRADEVGHELTPEQILANAPSKQGNLFKVPPVL
jgi:aspartyl-tRNA(Asn)/glutamyl-tRNA(Gln) amidotransferase subunit C